jgi:DNA-binding MarR family transcriptional regulator
MATKLNPEIESIETRVALGRLLRSLEVFRNIDKDMTLGSMVSLVQVSLNEGMSITELSRQTGDLLATTSRYVQALGDLRHDRKPGASLIDSHIDPLNFRKKVLRLTPSGRQRVNQLADAVMSRTVSGG